MAEPVHLNAASFKKAIESSDTPVLVDFWATWCGPCRDMEPVLKDLAKELDGKLVVGKVDVDENPSLAQQFGVMGIPALILFKQGREVARLIGARPKASLLQGIQQHLS